MKDDEPVYSDDKKYKVMFVGPDDIEAEPYEDALMDASEAGGVSAVDAVFEKLQALGDKKRQRIVSTIEKSFVEDTIEMAKEIKAFLKSTPEGSFSIGMEDMAGMDEAAAAQAMLRIFTKTAEVLGDKALPFTKAFVQQADKLSADERKSMTALTLTAVKAYDVAFPPKSAPKKQNRPGSKGPGA
jgi:hypothetical protein